MPRPRRWWMISGIALDIVGVGLIAASLVAPGPWLWVGLGCVAAGMTAVSLGAAAEDPPPRTAAQPDAAASWRPEPELRAAPPRATRPTPTALLIVWAWLMMLLAGGLLFWDRVWSLNPPVPLQGLLDEEGASADGEIHAKEIREIGGEPRRYLLYNFTDAEGKQLRASVVVGRRAYESRRTGESIEIRYLPGEPSLHYLPALTRPPFAERAALAATLLLLAAAGFLGFRARRHRRLVSRGAPAPAKVENARRRGGSRVYEARYRVGGRDYVLKAVERNPERRSGDVVTLVYDPDRPEDAEIYRLCLFRAKPA